MKLIRRYKIVAFGHTHKQADKRGFVKIADLNPKSMKKGNKAKFEECRTVNTDAWRPVVYARVVDARSDEDSDNEKVEAKDKIKFLREEHPSGVFTMEYKAAQNGKPAEAVYTSSFYTAVKTKL